MGIIKNIKDFYFAFSIQKMGKKTYFYETDNKYFIADKPGRRILEKSIIRNKKPTAKKIIDNPWLNWENSNPELITSKNNGIPINYLKTTDQDFVQLIEDRKLVDLYSKLVKTLDISKPFSFNDICQWHYQFFKDIYPFAGKTRTVEMSKKTDYSSWLWKLEFLKGIPDLETLIINLSSAEFANSTKEDVKIISDNISKLMSEFLFIHPFREGNGRICRLVGDIILAKNGFPMIGMNLKTKEEYYIKCVQEGYNKNYNPLSKIIEEKIILRMDS